MVIPHFRSHSGLFTVVGLIFAFAVRREWQTGGGNIENLPIELSEQCAHAWRVKVVGNERLVLIEVFLIVNLSSAPFSLELSVC